MLRFLPDYGRFWLKFRQFYPEKLPSTVSELDDFTTNALLVASLPDLPEYRRVIATTMMHLGPVTDRKSLRFFSRSLRRALLNQAAFDKIQAIIQQEKDKLQSKEALSDESSLEVPKDLLV